MLTDTHCHLYYEELFKDLAGVLDRAHEQGVNRFICVGTNIQDSKKAYQLLMIMKIYLPLQAFILMMQKTFLNHLLMIFII